jgi:DNA-binding response OmpR family regulator
LEDDRDTRWALAMVLRQEGAEVTEAPDGREGLGLLSRGQYDLVISDVSMSGLGGFGVFAALRFGDGEKFEAHRSLPMMIVSGRASRGELARALDAGVDEFMVKPVDPDEFKARVRTVLRRARRAAPPQARTSGDLRDFGMRSLGQALHTAGRTARLMVQCGDRCGVLDFLNGRIVHAEYEAPGVADRGETAAVDVLALEDGVCAVRVLRRGCTGGEQERGEEYGSETAHAES